MTNRTHLTRCATLAIAATLALPSTSLLAQDVAAPPAAAPVIVVPDVTVTAPPPAPTIVIPDVQAVEPAAPAAARPVRAAPRAAAPAPTRAVARQAPVAAAPEPAPVAETAVIDTAPVEVAPVSAAPVPILAPEPVPAAETATGLDDATIFGLGAIGVLGLIAVLFAATRRRRPKTSPEAAAPRIERPIVQREPLAALPEGTAAPEFPAGIEPTAAYTPAPSVSYAAGFGAPKAAPSSSLSHSGAAVALPREAPKSIEEREALMQRMITAQPDRANPFRSTRARAKRARLILASLGRDFTDAKPWIDLSQYSSNWPEVARRHSAAA